MGTFICYSMNRLNKSVKSINELKKSVNISISGNDNLTRVEFSSPPNSVSTAGELMTLRHLVSVQRELLRLYMEMACEVHGIPPSVCRHSKTCIFFEKQ